VIVQPVLLTTYPHTDPMLRPFLQRTLKILGISLLAVLVIGLASSAAIAATETPTSTTQPSATSYFEQITQLRETAFGATNQGDFATAEVAWTKLIEQLPENPALWSNRGNSRVSQGKYDAALTDFAKAIELAPEALDPYLNRGAAYEGLGKYAAAIGEYNHVIELDPKDAAAYNNRGNAQAAIGQWDTALVDYKQAALLAKDFAIARANDEAIRNLKNVVRKYPQFTDARAALTAALWSQGKVGEAESNWVAVVELDRHYKDLDWVKSKRRWSPAMVEALGKFLKLT
jgi:tetratricopeptide (TPR) repeat protein